VTDNRDPETFAELRNDEDVRVRWSVAQNRSTPKEVLAGLADDMDEYVRRRS